MDDSRYIDPMEKKAEDSKPSAFGPTPVKKAAKPHEAKWRTDKALYEKVLAAAAVEACKAQLQTGHESEISFNSQLTWIAQQFVISYEEKFGPLPGPNDPQGIRRYAQAALKK